MRKINENKKYREKLFTFPLKFKTLQMLWFEEA
jgi:hypothetical protein